MRRTAAVIAIATVGALVTGSPADAAEPITCGAVVSSDAYLATDLSCSGTGLTVIGDDVDIDLRGHTLSGDSEPGSVGIDVKADFVHIHDGSVSDWENAILALDPDDDGASVVPDGRLSYVTVSNSEVGLATFGATDFTVFRGTFEDNGVGIGPRYDEIDNGAFRVNHSAFRRNGVGVLLLRDAPGVELTMVNSKLEENRTAIRCDESNVDVSATQFAENTSAVWLYRCSGSTVNTSTFRGNTVGLRLDQSDGGGYGSGVEYAVTDNKFVANTDGIIIGNEAGVGVTGNYLTQNDRAIRLSAGEFTWGVIEDNSITRNDEGLRLERENDLVVRGNRATYNRGWGLYVQYGADGGGNTATGNVGGNCLGVDC